MYVSLQEDNEFLIFHSEQIKKLQTLFGGVRSNFRRESMKPQWFNGLQYWSWDQRNNIKYDGLILGRETTDDELLVGMSSMKSSQDLCF